MAERSAVISKLEHAINVEEVSGITPMMRTNVVIGERVSLIDNLFGQLRELNKEICESIQRILKMEDYSDPTIFIESFSQPPEGLDCDTALLGSGSFADALGPLEENAVLGTEVPANGFSVSEQSSLSGAPTSLTSLLLTEARQASQNINGLALRATQSTKDLAAVQVQGIRDLATSAKKSAVALIAGDDDGHPLGAGFVSFKSLRATQSALQMIQYPEPFAMETFEAPDPKGECIVSQIEKL